MFTARSLLFASLLLTPLASAESLTVPRIATRPHLSDLAAVESSLARVEGLVQRTPVDGEPITERTIVYLGYDAEHLYAVFVCWHPRDSVRAHRVNRDRIPDDDDSVAIQLDTFHDRRRLYGFQVNPAGVQVDGVYTEGKGWDLSFDTVWNVETLMQPDRYLILITIPFDSVRFPSLAEQEWGLFLYRGMPRKNEEAFWPAYSTRYQGRLAYSADLRGLRDLGASRQTQVVPYGTFRTGSLTSGAPALDEERVSEARAGADVKTIFRDSLVLDITAKPDFSQVESDEPQVAVNRRFELFFPEKRPFFVENTSYFETPFQVLFTRRIRDPRVGTRLTGKAGRYAFGALVADDVSAGGTDARAWNAVVRLSRDVGTESQLGVIYTGRRESDTANHAGGIDGRWRIHRNWVATAQALASRDRDDESRSRNGTAMRAAVEGSGRSFVYKLTWVDITPDFRAASGFIPRTDMREVTQVSNAIFRPAARGIVSWGPGLTLTRVSDHDGVVLDSSAKLEARLELARSTQVSLFHARSDERLRVIDAPSLPQATLFPQRTTGATFTSAPLPLLAFSGEVSFGEAVNLTPAAGRPPELGNSRQGSLTVSLRPVPALTIDTTYLWTMLSDRHHGDAIFDNHIVRSRWSYQITPRLSARAIARLDELSADPSASSLPERRDLNLDFLVTYLVQPGTAVYVGWNSDEQRVAGSEGQQVFVKVSYLFRL